MIVYRIRHWSRHFENNKSRGIKAPRYVCLPNKQDGLGLLRILAETDGAAILGVWCLILQACSRQAERDGWLTDDGSAKGRPWDLDDLAFRWRRPRSEIERCLALVCDSRIAWMEALESKCPPSGTIRPRGVLEGREGTEGTEGTGTAGAAPRRDEDQGELFDPKPDATAKTDEQIALGLTAWVRWQSPDREREQRNVATIAGLVAEYGPKTVQEAAYRVRDREKRQAWPNELLPEILGAKPDPTQNPREPVARSLLERHGWEAVCDAAGLPRDRVGDADVMLQAMMADVAIHERAAAKLEPRGVA